MWLESSWWQGFFQKYPKCISRLSVTRLSDFWKFLVTHFLSKVPKMHKQTQCDQIEWFFESSWWQVFFQKYPKSVVYILGQREKPHFSCLTTVVTFWATFEFCIWSLLGAPNQRAVYQYIFVTVFKYLLLTDLVFKYFWNWILLSLNSSKIFFAPTEYVIWFRCYRNV